MLSVPSLHFAVAWPGWAAVAAVARELVAAGAAVGRELVAVGAGAAGAVVDAAGAACLQAALLALPGFEQS
jgi:hypothetical protein